MAASQSNSDSRWLDYVSNPAGTAVNIAKKSGQSLVEDVENYARSGNVVKDVARVSSDSIKFGKDTYNAIEDDGSNPNAGVHKRNLRKIDEALGLLPEFSEQ